MLWGRDGGTVKHLRCEIFVSCADGPEGHMCSEYLSDTGRVGAAGILSGILLLAGSALCPVVLGTPFPHPGCGAIVICCPSLLLLTLMQSQIPISSPGIAQAPSLGDRDPAGRGKVTLTAWEQQGTPSRASGKRRSPSAAGFLGFSVSS